jgi:dihydroorotate dehydrogenase electron transfer subunit
VSIALAPAVVVERSVPMAGAVELVLHHPPSATAVRPGQFFQLAVNAPHTILRRPYSAAWSDPPNGRIGFIFNVVGAGSAWLSALGAGDEVDLLGPLGRGFELDSERPAVCIAGGLGVALFPGLVEALIARGRKVMMLQGARTAPQLLPADRFPGADVGMATNDGSRGHHGSVVDLIPSHFPPRFTGKGQGGSFDLFACGPTPMLRALIDAARRQEIPDSSIQVALETPMGCGVGTCLGCAAPRREAGYLLTCKDGPSVRADRIDWNRMEDQFHG